MKYDPIAVDFRSRKHERLAALYDEEILPIWSHRFGALLLRRLSLPERAMILDVGGGTGYPALEILRRMDEGGRLLCIEPSAPMLEVARRKAGVASGPRLFFRTESAVPRLSFAAEVFDRVVANLVLPELPDPARAVADFARVAKPGGAVLCTLPLRGTWAEVLDLFREVLLRTDRLEALDRLDFYAASLPDAEEVRGWYARAGMARVAIDEEPFELLFRSSRELFFAPLIEYGPLAAWKTVAGEGAEVQEVFRAVGRALDAYFADRPFAVTVRAACAVGEKSGEES